MCVCAICEAKQSAAHSRRLAGGLCGNFCPKFRDPIDRFQRNRKISFDDVVEIPNINFSDNLVARLLPQ